MAIYINKLISLSNNTKYTKWYCNIITNAINRNFTNRNSANKILGFYHKVYGERICSRNELKKEFPYLLSSGLYNLINHINQSYKGWTLDKNHEIKQTNENTNYTFYHDDYCIEICTYIELSAKYNLSKSKLCNILRCNEKTHKGWRITKDKIECNFQRDNNNYTFYHKDRGYKTCTRLELLNYVDESTRNGICLLINGSVQSHCGWFLIS